MSASQKFKADAAIYARREQEFHMQKLNNQLAGDRNLAHRAHWEHKSDKQIVNRIVAGRTQQMRNQFAANLEARRAKLAALLAAEDKMYEQEFNENLETPDQVRQHMHARLQVLQGKYEEERQTEVQRRYDQRFKMQNDALRAEDGKFYTHGTQIEREKQLIDKRRKIEQQMLEEQVYAQLYALDAQKKLEREIKEAAEKKQAISDTIAVLDWQKQTKQVEKVKEVDQVAKERVMLKAQWDDELIREKHAEQEKFVLNRERNCELISHNKQERALKEQADLAEKQRDLQLLKARLAQEKALEEMECDARTQQRREALEVQQYAQVSAAEKQAYEKMIDELVAAKKRETDAKQEQQWDREDAARINLLKSVFASREQEVSLHQQKKQNEVWMKQYERRNMEDEVDRQNKAYEDQMLKTSLAKKSHQTDILRQVSERDRTMRRELQEVMYEERAAKLAELEYQRRIKTEMDNNKQMLTTWKNTINQH